MKRMDLVCQFILGLFAVKMLGALTATAVCLAGAA